MSTGEPQELRFDFIPVKGDEKAAPASGEEQASAPESSEDAADGATNEDHAAELKRRVAQLRSTARRTRHDPEAEFAEPRSSTVTPLRPDVSVDGPEEGIQPEEEAETDGALTIASFYERVRRALSSEFTDEVWVVGEIRGFRESRGHRFLELADRGKESAGRNVAQQLEVVCWAREWPPIGRALAEAGVDLEVGRVVRVRGKVSVWEGAGKLRFTLTALDVEALLGGIAAARRRLLTQLAEEDLLEANRRQFLTPVPLRIGIVTSPGSEAHRDFVGQLDRSGFAFEVHLEQSLVQGNEAPNQIASALSRMTAFAPDVAVVIRGGGARGDLAAFDTEVVARAIATAPFPVWTGIGHTGDRSVADEVAHHALITPTACGEAIVTLVDSYWSDIMRKVESASSLARARLDGAAHSTTSSANALVRGLTHQLHRRQDGLEASRNALDRAIRGQLRVEERTIHTAMSTIAGCVRHALVVTDGDVARHRQVLNAFDPQRQRERGWALVHDADGRLVRSVTSLRPGERLVTQLVDGAVTSVVESASENPVPPQSASEVTK